jgi:hypothetical protein
MLFVTLESYNGITFSFIKYTVSISQWLCGSKACVCDRWLAEIVGSNPAMGNDVFLL